MNLLLTMNLMNQMILKTSHSRISLIITAAGSSSRMGSSIKKEYLKYKNGTVLSASTKTLINSVIKTNQIAHIIITYPKEKLELCKNALYCDKELELILQNNNLSITFIEGSDTRQSSVFNALEFIKNNNECDYVFIHDGARPFIKEETIVKILSLIPKHSAISPGLTPTDTIKTISKDGFIKNHLQRSSLFAVQTPQCFAFKKLYNSHIKARDLQKEFTDDTEIFALFEDKVFTILGDEENIKITYPKDLEKL